MNTIEGLSEAHFLDSCYGMAILPIHKLIIAYSVYGVNSYFGVFVILFWLFAIGGGLYK